MFRSNASQLSAIRGERELAVGWVGAVVRCGASPLTPAAAPHLADLLTEFPDEMATVLGPKE